MISKTLQDALNLRSARKIPEALQKLEKACEEKDPNAYFLLSCAYLRGGWGLHINETKRRIYWEDAKRLGCKYTDDRYIFSDEFQTGLANNNPFAISIAEADHIETSLETAQKLNDARYWYLLALNSFSCYAYEQAAEQKHYYAMQTLMEMYSPNTKKGFKYCIEGRFYREQEEILQNGYYEHLIGKEIYHNNMHPLKNSDLGKKAIAFYLNNIQHVRSQVITFLCICKFLKLPRDTSRLIARLVWAFRDDF